MNLAAWNEDQVAQKWVQTDSDEGPCIRCHINGQASFLASDESERVFNVLSTRPVFLQRYFVASIADPLIPKMEINTGLLNKVANAIGPYIERPQFDENDESMQALRSFFTKTKANETSGACVNVQPEGCQATP